jgi:hypothetical protein
MPHGVVASRLGRALCETPKVPSHGTRTFLTFIEDVRQLKRKSRTKFELETANRFRLDRFGRGSGFGVRGTDGTVDKIVTDDLCRDHLLHHCRSTASPNPNQPCPSAFEVVPNAPHSPASVTLSADGRYVASGGWFPPSSCGMSRRAGCSEPSRPR